MSYLSSAEPAAAASQTEPWWWCNSPHCPACGSYSAWHDRLSHHPSPVWTVRRPLGDKGQGSEATGTAQLSRSKQQNEIRNRLCVCALFTLRGFALSDQIGAPRIAGGQQLSFCILTAQLTEVPAVTTGRHQSASKKPPCKLSDTFT